jgi:aspartyl-tRNA(Asn)/glutamyl-tRNA(Gln) amidotransferase subunit C
LDRLESEDNVGVEDVRRIAELANLRLDAAEEAGMQRDLNAILTYVAQLNELDTSAISPMAQVSEVVGDASASLRADRQRPSLERSDVMVSAPGSDGVFFKVPKVIER